MSIVEGGQAAVSEGRRRAEYAGAGADHGGVPAEPGDRRVERTLDRYRLALPTEAWPGGHVVQDQALRSSSSSTSFESQPGSAPPGALHVPERGQPPARAEKAYAAGRQVPVQRDHRRRG